MNKKSLPGLLDLTQAVLERSFKDYRLDQLTADHMEVLSGIVFHHMLNLPMAECDVLTSAFGVGTHEIETLEVIGKELGMTASETEEFAAEAFQHLVDASWVDILKTLIDIENERAQS